MAEKKSPLTVLFFSPYFYPYISGLTQYPYRLFSEHKENMSATCLTFQHDVALPPTTTITHNFLIKRIPFLLRISKGFISPQSILTFWRELDHHDVVLLNLPSVEGILLALFARMRAVPVVSLLHCEVLLPPGILNRIVNSVLNVCVYLQLLLSEKIIVYTTDYYDSKPLYNRFKQKMHVILPPVHSEAPSTAFEQELGIMKNSRTAIGFCGRIAYEKGIETLIEALKKMDNYVLFFAGPHGKEVVGEDVYYAKIHHLLTTFKIPHIFLGTLSGPKLSAFYNAIDVLVLPSINKTEAFGMVQVEAMLQGTPVIASDLPGVRIPIRLSHMGVLTAPGDSIKLTDAIKEVTTHTAQYTNAHLTKQIATHFDSQKTYQTVYNLLNSYGKKNA
ncbi:MAG: glycosyltransferase family 4 protein [Microgenomates group bacterium]